MIFSLLGYMGCGKSHISKLLSQTLQMEHLDLDREISQKKKLSVGEIFEQKGELYFRKTEKEVLEELLATKENLILSVGGGTPVYYNNMELLNSCTTTIFLRAKVGTLYERLIKNKKNRPLIARIPDEELTEFIAKHLFERNVYYQKAQHIVDVDGKSPEEIVQEISISIPPHH